MPHPLTDRTHSSHPAAPESAFPASPAALSKPTQRRVQRVRHELQRREVRVVDITRISPGFLRLRFQAEALRSFVSLSFDDHVKFIFNDAAGQAHMRDYTPRAFDGAAGTLDIEFALHEHGPATDWARQARLGDVVSIAGPRGSMVIDPLHDWHLLACDATGLPALCRRLEELPASTQALVLVDLADARDQRVLASAANVQVRWVQGSEAWLDALQQLQLPAAGDGYAWCAGEARVMARARELLVHHHRLSREAMRVAAYWKLGADSFHERLEG